MTVCLVLLDIISLFPYVKQINGQLHHAAKGLTQRRAEGTLPSH